MQKNRIIFWSLLLTGTLLILIIIVSITNLPWLANHFGFALSGEDGLPFRISYQDRDYANLATCAHANWCQQKPASLLCKKQADLQQTHQWPLAQVSSLFVVPDSSYPVMASPKVAAHKITAVVIYVMTAENCYVPYELEGSP